MLTPPEGLSTDTLYRVLSGAWGLAIASIDYRQLGFGSHHWEVVDGDGVRRFLTVDVLAGRGQVVNEPEEEAFDRLRAALTTATDLRHSGATFAIAPIPTLSGEPLVRSPDGYALALYPFVTGQSFSPSDVPTPAHRRGLLDLLIALHAMPISVLRRPVADECTIPHHDELELSLDGNRPPGVGPYAHRAATLLAQNDEPITRQLDRYDRLVDGHRREPDRTVITHGEPHPGNTMRTSSGWVLVDWDTALVAPPERDLWGIDPGDGSMLSSYADGTGTTLQGPTLELYRTRWDLADIAAYASYFRAPHADDADAEKSWNELCILIGRHP